VLVELLRLLSELDIGRAAFVALVALVFWLGRDMLRTLRAIERHNAEAAVYMRQTARVMQELTGLLRRRGIELRLKEEEVKT